MEIKPKALVISDIPAPCKKSSPKEIIGKTTDAMRELDFPNWKPIQEREVVTQYRKKVDYDGICLLVTGIDRGNIWWHKEKPNIWEEQEADKK